ncbi:MAG TPA: 30S ribosomal protein S16 [Candidatus Limnocylindrales bacterium]|nr:30S ribosomal protein S16 [Candidatus Limnocylindrales bacterium]
MAVRIRLLRMGKIRNPQYRIVVADSRTKRDGKAIEFIGVYHPKEDPSRIEVNSERVQYWLSVGAQPSEPVLAILSKTGDWQRFKGLPPPAEPLKVAAPKADRKATYEAEAQAAAGLEAPKAPAKKAEKRAEPKAEAPKAEAEAPKAEAPKPKADEPKAEAPKPKAEEPKAEEPKEPKADEPKADAAAEETAVEAGDEQQG